MIYHLDEENKSNNLNLIKVILNHKNFEKYIFHNSSIPIILS